MKKILKKVKSWSLRILNFKLINGKRLNWLLREWKFNFGYFEPEFKIYVATFVRKEDVFIDIGANVGVLSEYASQHCKLVMAFDPDRDCAIALANKFYSINNVLIFPFGLGLNSKLSEFIGTKGSGRSSFFYNSNHELEVTHRYLTFQLGIKELFSELQSTARPNRISIKLDIEGGEHFIIADICEYEKVSSVYLELTEENRDVILEKLANVRRKIVFYYYNIEKKLYNSIDIDTLRIISLKGRSNIVVECL